jgi:glutamyl-tRNA reductase
VTRGSFVLTGARLTHEHTTVADLETATRDPNPRYEELLGREGVSEAFILQTCNRIEEYVVADDPQTGRAALTDFAPDAPPSAVVRMDHEGSLRHLLRVTAGLESQVLGEDQIMGQFRRSYSAAEEAGAIGPILEAGLLKAIHVGERARTETAINDGIVSLGRASVTLADTEVGLAGSTVLIVGAGETAELVADALDDAALEELRVANRTKSRANRLAADRAVNTVVDTLDDLAVHLQAADVVFSSTGSPAPLIDEETLSGAGSTMIFDLAQPRDVTPAAGERSEITVRDLDDLEVVTADTHRDRKEAAAAVESIVDEEFDLLIDQYKRQRADAVIKAMYRGAEGIKRRELRTTLAKLDEDLDDEGRAVVEDLADALVSQLLAIPTKSLRDAAAEDDWEAITTAIRLFEPALEDDVIDSFGRSSTGEASADSGDY